MEKVKELGKWYKVKIYFDDEIYEDEIKGTNEEDALFRAYWNWDAVKIEIIS